MLYYDRIDVSDGFDVNKICPSKECEFSHYWHFLSYDFKFQPNACNRCYDLLMMSIAMLLFLTLKALIIAVLLV